MESEMAAAIQNKLAGAYLKRVREGLGLEQKEFAPRLTDQLRAPVTPGAYSTYEGGTRPVPAAVVIAASQIARVPILIDQVTEETFVEQIVRLVLERLQDQPASPSGAGPTPPE
jgi:transcriptional regulator with XRE-family HTH domain